MSDRFARTNLASGFAMSVMFGRDGSGAMTSRLFATNPQLGAIYEMNPAGMRAPGFRVGVDLRSEEHTSEPSHTVISYAVFCLKKKNKYRVDTYHLHEKH